MTWSWKYALDPSDLDGLSPGRPAITAVEFASDRFVIGGTYGWTWHTTDAGENWTTVASASAYPPNRIDYVNGFLFYSSGSGAINSSSNLGVSWATTPNSFYTTATNGWHGAAYNGTNLIVVDGTNDPRIAISTDGGANFTGQNAINPGLTAGTWHFARTIAFGAGIFVIGAFNGQMLRSSTGLYYQWTATTSSFGTSAINDIAWDGSQFIAVGDGGKIATSPNGITWTQLSHPNGTANLKRIAVDANWCIITTESGYVVWRTADLSTWVVETLNFGTPSGLSYVVPYQIDIAAGGAKFMAVAPASGGYSVAVFSEDLAVPPDVVVSPTSGSILFAGGTPTLTVSPPVLSPPLCASVDVACCLCDCRTIDCAALKGTVSYTPFAPNVKTLCCPCS